MSVRAWARRRLGCAPALVALLLAGGGGSSFAQAGPPDCTADLANVAAAATPSDEGTGAPTPDRGFLWRLSKNGRSSWLYGTIHVGRPDWAVPGPQVDAAFRASDTLALEIDVLDPQMQLGFMQAVTKSAGTPFASVGALPAELRERLRRLLAASCIPAAPFETFPTQLAVAMLTGKAARRDGFEATGGIDLALDHRARSVQRAVVSLETPELQAHALQMPSDAPDAIAYVSDALAAIEDGSARIGLLHIAKVWADGDWPGLSSYADWCDCLKTAADRADMKRLLDDRNPGLADAIAALHASGKRVFAAVGSLHMIGPLGVPAQLVARGFEVERIPLADRSAR